MIRGLYTAGSGMLAAQAQSDIIGDNVANLKTPGYKAEQGSAQAFPSQLIERLGITANGNAEATLLGSIGTGVIVDRISKFNIQGVIQTTDKVTDLALNTPGYFVVQTGQGERYTRNGQFQLNALGALQTADGYAVLGENGPIGVSNHLSQQFKVASDGTVTDGGKVIDHLRVVDIPESALEREGQSLYSANQTSAATLVQIRQGAFEASNVDAASQMVQMITVMRAYEANQKVIQTQDATLEKAVNEVGKI
ncbi:MAG: flagellar hook-basal body protein [Desulfitobacteriaceae bacterium]